MPAEVLPEHLDVVTGLRDVDAALVACASAGSFTYSFVGVEGDESPVVPHALHHGQRTVGLLLKDDAFVVERLCNRLVAGHDPIGRCLLWTGHTPPLAVPIGTLANPGYRLQPRNSSLVRAIVVDGWAIPSRANVAWALTLSCT